MEQQEFVVLHCAFFFSLLLCFFHNCPFYLWGLVSLVVIQVSHVLSIPLCDFMTSTNSVFSFSRFFAILTTFRGPSNYNPHRALFARIVSSCLWHVEWNAPFLTNSIGNEATIRQSSSPRLFQWVCACCNCHSCHSAPIPATNCSMGTVCFAFLSYFICWFSSRVNFPTSVYSCSSSGG